MLLDFSGNSHTICLRPLEGHDELLITEYPWLKSSFVTDLLAQVILSIDGAAPDRESVANLNLGERDIVLARIRLENFGDQVITNVNCPECGDLLELDFSLEAFLDHNHPRSVNGVELDKDGWFRLIGHDITFRLPTGADIEMMEQEVCPKELARRKWLVMRCVRPADLPSKFLKRIERATWHLSPQLSQELEAYCAVCGKKFPALFDIESFFFRELEIAVRSLYREVHLLANSYHWREEEILALPRHRRLRYVDELLKDLR